MDFAVLDCEVLDEIPVNQSLFFPSNSAEEEEDPLNLTDCDPLNSSPIITPTPEIPVSAPPPTFNKPQVNYANRSQFFKEMRENIDSVIKESIQLFKKPPTEYHPFYLRVLKYIIIGQKFKHIGCNDKEVYAIWNEYDDVANTVWKIRDKMIPYSQSDEPSPYALFIQTGKVFKDGKVVQVVRNKQEIEKGFKELEKIAQRIRKKWRGGPEVNLKTRLEFFNECKIFTFPADVVKMNDLWHEFIKGTIGTKKQANENTKNLKNLRSRPDLISVSLNKDIVQEEVVLLSSDDDIEKINRSSPPLLPRQEPVASTRSRRKRKQKEIISDYDDEDVNGPHFDNDFLDDSPPSPLEPEPVTKKSRRCNVDTLKVTHLKELKVILGSESCPYCEQTTFVRESLDRHLENKHPKKSKRHPQRAGHHSKDLLKIKVMLERLKQVQKLKLERKKRETDQIKLRRKKRFLTSWRLNNRRKCWKRIFYQMRIEKCSDKMERTLGFIISRRIRKPKCLQINKSKRPPNKKPEPLKRNRSKSFQKRETPKSSRRGRKPAKSRSIETKVTSVKDKFKSVRGRKRVNLSPMKWPCECSHCDEILDSMTESIQHMRTFHPDEVPLPKKKKKKKKKSKGDKVICDECGSFHATTSALRSHRNRVHVKSRLPLNKCPFCEQTFKDSCYLWSHFLSGHTKYNLGELSKAKGELMGISFEHTAPIGSKGRDRTFKVESSGICDVCGAELPNSRHLDKHLRQVHGTDTISCNICNKTFKSKCARDAHVRQNHQGLAIKCDICNRKMQGLGKLWRHKVEFHGMTDLEPPEGVKVQKCPYCEEKLLRGLVVHVRKLHPEKLDDFAKLEIIGETGTVIIPRKIPVTSKEKREEFIRQRREVRRRWREEGILTYKWMIRECPLYKCHLCEWPTPENKSQFIWLNHLKQAHGIEFAPYNKNVPKYNPNSKVPKDAQLELRWVCPFEGCKLRFQSPYIMKKHAIRLHSMFEKNLCEGGYVDVQKTDSNIQVELTCKVCEDPEEMKALFGKTKLNNFDQMKIHFFLTHPQLYDTLRGSIDPELSLGEEVQQVFRKTLGEIFKCPHCAEECEGKEDLREHVECLHPETCCKCPLDGKILLGPEELEEHFNAEHGPPKENAEDIGSEAKSSIKRRKCYRCGEYTDDIHDHMLEKHPTCIFKCSMDPNCKIVRYTKNAIICHEHKSHIQAFLAGVNGNIEPIYHSEVPCEFCDEMISAEGLSLHFRTVHEVNEDPWWVCEVCSFHADSRALWMSHMEEWHFFREENWEKLLSLTARVNIKTRRSEDKVEEGVVANKVTAIDTNKSHLKNIEIKKPDKSSKTPTIKRKEEVKKKCEIERSGKKRQVSELDEAPPTRKSSRMRKTKTYKEYDVKIESDTEKDSN